MPPPAPVVGPVRPEAFRDGLPADEAALLSRQLGAELATLGLGVHDLVPVGAVPSALPSSAAAGGVGDAVRLHSSSVKPLRASRNGVWPASGCALRSNQGQGRWRSGAGREVTEGALTVPALVTLGLVTLGVVKDAAPQRGLLQAVRGRPPDLR